MISTGNYTFVPAETMAFESIREFKRALMWGAEIEFIWDGVTYDVIRYGTDKKSQFIIQIRMITILIGQRLAMAARISVSRLIFGTLSQNSKEFTI